MYSFLSWNGSWQSWRGIHWWWRKLKQRSGRSLKWSRIRRRKNGCWEREEVGEDDHQGDIKVAVAYPGQLLLRGECQEPCDVPECNIPAKATVLISLFKYPSFFHIRDGWNRRKKILQRKGRLYQGEEVKIKEERRIWREGYICLDIMMIVKYLNKPLFVLACICCNL